VPSLKANKEEEPVQLEEYDRAVRELQFGRRGQALDVCKTKEELAAVEEKRLEKLEVSKNEYMWRSQSNRMLKVESYAE